MPGDLGRGRNPPDHRRPDHNLILIVQGILAPVARVGALIVQGILALDARVGALIVQGILALDAGLWAFVPIFLLPVQKRYRHHRRGLLVVEARAGVLPVARIKHESCAHRVVMHVPQLLLEERSCVYLLGMTSILP